MNKKNKDLFGRLQHLGPDTPQMEENSKLLAHLLTSPSSLSLILQNLSENLNVRFQSVKNYKKHHTIRKFP